MEQLIKIPEFIMQSFLHIWPYLLITIPLAVIVNLSGASRYISGAFGKNPLLSVLFATLVGAFSPFCSCGVIPVISSLLLGGVPLGPVMSFWIASPSMDPEIFFLSTSMIGWKMAIWRLASTFIISLLAGYITHYVTKRGYIGDYLLITRKNSEKESAFRIFVNSIRSLFSRNKVSVELLATNDPGKICGIASVDASCEKSCCSIPQQTFIINCENPDNEGSHAQWKRVFPEIMRAMVMVTKFMALAFLITAIMNLYMPENMISFIVKSQPSIQIILSTLIGIPIYANNLTALPMISGLIDLGLNRGAAISFLISGATTTLPAMIAVWGITKKKIFVLYISFALLGSLLAGFLFNLFN